MNKKLRQIFFALSTVILVRLYELSTQPSLLSRQRLSSDVIETFMAPTPPPRTFPGKPRFGGHPMYRAGLPWVRLMMVWFLYVAAFSGGQVLQKYRMYEHVELGYGIGEQDVYKTVSNASSLGYCRMLCLADVRCGAVTILEANRQISCNFSGVLTIGHLYKIAGAVTIFMAASGPFICDAPYINVRGVGCIRVVDDIYLSRYWASQHCVWDNATFFYADSPQHLRRLYDNFLSKRAVTIFNLWVGTAPNLWWLNPSVNRTIHPEELEDPTFMGNDSHVINPRTGKLVGKDKYSGDGYICEKKYP